MKDEWAEEYYPGWYWCGLYRDSIGTIGTLEIVSPVLVGER